jgi:hypothetical protein
MSRWRLSPSYGLGDRTVCVDQVEVAEVADERGAKASDIVPWVAASAMMRVHPGARRGYRRGILQQMDTARFAREIECQLKHAVALLEHGLGTYATK